MLLSKKKTILVSPLNWGLGHATRMIPVIRSLTDLGHDVVIGAYGSSAILLKKEFGGCIHVQLEGFTPKYSSAYSQSLALMFQSLKFLYHKHKEYKKTKEIVRKYDIDVIVSDNRYGVRHKDIPSVIVTHQLSPALSGIVRIFEKPVSYIFGRWINKFSECWIPDIEEPQDISGKLSKNRFVKINVRYAGVLSRFRECEKEDVYKYDYAAVISGPEPWRSKFEKDLTAVFGNFAGHTVIVRGIPEGGNEEHRHKGVTFIDHLNAEALNSLMCKSRHIICRPGYSTLMDLFKTGRRALLVPTPGQPEQEYLAEYMSKEHGFTAVAQKDISAVDVSVFARYEDRLRPLNKGMSDYFNTFVRSNSLFI